MVVSMVCVRKVRMRVCNEPVTMCMRMARSRQNGMSVLVLMMRIVLVFMLMIKNLVRMLVLVAFGQVQPNTARHQQTGGQKSSCYGFIQQDDCGERSSERRGREICAGPRCSERAQSNDE